MKKPSKSISSHKSKRENIEGKHLDEDGLYKIYLKNGNSIKLCSKVIK